MVFKNLVYGEKSPKASGTENGEPSNRTANVSQRSVKPANNFEPALSALRVMVTGKPFYRPLDFDSFEIRLLKLQRVTDKGGFTCSLEYASLINPPDYIAL
jgi:hypothetical protein